jgi:hypothetical protein
MGESQLSGDGAAFRWRGAASMEIGESGHGAKSVAGEKSRRSSLAVSGGSEVGEGSRQAAVIPAGNHTPGQESRRIMVIPASALRVAMTAL